MSFLALTLEPAWLGWVALIGGPLSIVLTAAAYFKLDSRYVLKSDADKVAKAERDYVDNLARERREERHREVRDLEKEDAELRSMIKQLTGTVDRHIAHYNSSQEKVQSEINAGFMKLTESMNTGLLMVSKDVAAMQGRLAGLGQNLTQPQPSTAS